MSTSAARAFLEKVAGDAGYRGIVEKAMEEKGDDAGVILTMAAGSGHFFTAQELSEALKTYPIKNRELNQKELETVAGGFNPQPEPPKIFNRFGNIFNRGLGPNAGVNPQPH